MTQKFPQTPSGNTISDVRNLYDWLRSIATELDYTNLKSGTSQADAKAVAGELWVNSATNIIYRGI